MIGVRAFSGCAFTSVAIPANVTTIGINPFDCCANLVNISVDENNTKYLSKDGCLIDKENKTLIGGTVNSIIPSDGSVTSIGQFAFHGIGITNIEIPNGVEAIEGYAFYYCDKLTEISISNSVTAINIRAFWNCSSLTNIIYDGTVDQWNSITFGSAWNTTTGEYTITCTNGTIAKNGTTTMNP